MSQTSCLQPIRITLSHAVFATLRGREIAGVTDNSFLPLDWMARQAAVLKTEIQRATDRLHHASLRDIPHNLARAIALHWHDKPSRTVPERPERVIVSLTTIPERSRRILPALRSLLDQTCPADAVVLAWPDRSLRTGQPYPEPPELPSGVRLLHCEDEGPASKLLAVLRLEPNAAIIVADDDIIYPNDFIANLLAAHRANPRAAVGWRGWQLSQASDPRHFRHIFATGIKLPTPVDVILGTWGYLIPPMAFDNAIFDIDAFPEELRWVDDVWISGNLARRGVQRLVVPAKSFPIETGAAFVAALTKTINRSGRNDLAAIEAFKPWW
jgi:hypothetical protein